MIGEVTEWFRATGDIPAQLFRHLQLSYVPVICAMVLAIPAGIYIGHARRFEFITVTVANLGRAIPSFAIISLALIVSINLGLGLGYWPTFAALFLLALPPLIVNTYTGVKNADPDTVEAARGQGLSEAQVVREIELPLAAPLVVAGIRTAAVQSVATATLGALVGAGGLGDYVVLGFRAGDDGALLGGGLLIALVAFVTEFSLAGVERYFRPQTGSGARGRPPIEPMGQLAQSPRAPDVAA